MPLHPISFSIPSELIVNSVPSKSCVVSKQDEVYTFDSETEYYKSYAHAYYGLTCKKGGWDCLRHYEILANGCIPFFTGLDAMPKFTMHDFPRELVTVGMQLSGVTNADALSSLDIGSIPQGALTEVIEALLHHTRCKLSTCARANEILHEMKIETCDVESVLFINSDPHPDYLRCLTLHGFKTLLGARCVDAIEVPHLYSDFPEERARALYGRGFTYTRKLDPLCRNVAWGVSDIPGMLRDNLFDLVVYGSAHRGTPFLDHVIDTMPADRVAFLCGEDEHPCALPALYSDRFHVFVRELQ